MGQIAWPEMSKRNNHSQRVTSTSRRKPEIVRKSVAFEFFLLVKTARHTSLTFRRRIQSRLPFAGIIRRLSYSTRFQDKG